MTRAATVPSRPSPLHRPLRAARAADTTPRAPWGWALAGALAGALPALLAFAPAHWLAAAVAQASGEQVQLLAPSGTVWTGSAQLVLTGGPGSQDRAALPARLHWRLRPAWGGLHAELRADCCTRAPLLLRLGVHWGGARVALADGQSQWPAAVLTGLGTPWNTLQLQARLHLTTPGLTLRITPKGVQGEGRATLDALDAASRLSTLRPMGSYRLVWQAADNAPLSLQTLQGALQLQGSGQWIAGRLRFEGQAEASPGREEALANLMNILGRRQGKRTLIKIG